MFTSAPHCPFVEGFGVADALIEEVVFDVEVLLVEVDEVNVDELLLVVVVIMVVEDLILELVDVMDVGEGGEDVVVMEELDRLEELVEEIVADVLLKDELVVLEVTGVMGLLLVVDDLAVGEVLGGRLLDAEGVNEDVLDGNCDDVDGLATGFVVVEELEIDLDVEDVAVVTGTGTTVTVETTVVVELPFEVDNVAVDDGTVEVGSLGLELEALTPQVPKFN